MCNQVFRIIFFLFFLYFLSSKIFAQSEFEIDLASTQQAQKKIIDVVEDQEFTITILNRIPNSKAKYKINFTEKVSPIEPPNLPGVVFAKETGNEIQNATECKQLIESYNKWINIISEISDEKKILEQITKLESGKIDLMKSFVDNCIDGMGSKEKLEKNLDSIIKRTKDDCIMQKATEKIHKLNLGMELEVKITRSISGGQTAEWILLFKTPPKGKWDVSFGYTFLPNWFKNNEVYSVLSAPDGKFKVKRIVRDAGYIDYLPGIFFHWNSAKQDGNDVKYSIMGGISLDSDIPAVELGMALNFVNFINLSFGLNIRRVSSPNPLYNEGDLISNDEIDKINEKSLRLGPFIGFSLNLLQNPFK